MGIKTANLQSLLEVNLSQLATFKVMSKDIGLLVLRIGREERLLETLANHELGALGERGQISNVVEMRMTPNDSVNGTAFDIDIVFLQNLTNVLLNRDLGTDMLGNANNAWREGLPILPDSEIEEDTLIGVLDQE